MASSCELATLYHYAGILGIQNIINDHTIDKPFKKPSGGEEKRIMLLRAILPILHGHSDIKVLFCDEITSGLDEINRVKVRSLIDAIKDKRVAIVSIDHGNIICDRSYKVQKKLYTTTSRKTAAIMPIFTGCSLMVKIKMLAYVWWRNQLLKYSQLNNVNEDQSDNNTGIHVWLPEYEPEPHC